ncbi:hypothetical protein SAMN04515674_10447 [Pseudarcicella hirudinis]|uniref:Uncharacterized protein n=1 Tax=Pseudarcicella hirudinis TaxID=1079859 RepID=A0A1I5RF08_9BACT|nr:hypothetical protein SAMN04515674_10447 [Pseudarcicella hirudinis]
MNNIQITDTLNFSASEGFTSKLYLYLNVKSGD